LALLSFFAPIADAEFRLIGALIEIYFLPIGVLLLFLMNESLFENNFYSNFVFFDSILAVKRDVIGN